MKKTICLNMIVKNEAHVIKRCLASVLPIIDTWAIVDTGSTDGTQEEVRRFFKDLPGELHERPWVNFGRNRQEALSLARPKADYILFMDADDVLRFADGFQMPELTKDFYGIITRGGQMDSWLPRLIKAQEDWSWEGAIHEYLESKNSKEGLVLEGVEYLVMHDGARSKDPALWKKDAELLKRAIDDSPHDPRNYFYLANTYNSVNEWQSALVYYQHFIEMNGGRDEKFFSLVAIAKIQEAMRLDPRAVQSSYFKAHKFSPYRLEPLFYLARNLRAQGEWEKAQDLCRIALSLPNPDNFTWMEKWIYEWGLMYEYAWSSAQSRRFGEADEACKKMLAHEDLPPPIRREMEDCSRFIVQQKLSQIEKIFG